MFREASSTESDLSAPLRFHAVNIDLSDALRTYLGITVVWRNMRERLLNLTFNLGKTKLGEK